MIPKGFAFWVIIALSVLAAGFVFVRFAFAHGPAEWIQRGAYKNAAGEMCCGERDCFEIADADVKIAADGYRVTLRTPTLQGIAVYVETIPFNEATPSPDGHYWRCQWGGTRKCFFAPPSAT